MRAFDAAACLLPGGHVLCIVRPVILSGSLTGWAGDQIKCFEFDGTTS
jgi:hypothetical protein